MTHRKCLKCKLYSLQPRTGMKQRTKFHRPLQLSPAMQHTEWTLAQQHRRGAVALRFQISKCHLVSCPFLLAPQVHVRNGHSFIQQLCRAVGRHLGPEKQCKCAKQSHHPDSSTAPKDPLQLFSLPPRRFQC